MTGALRLGVDPQRVAADPKGCIKPAQRRCRRGPGREKGRWNFLFSGTQPQRISLPATPVMNLVLPKPTSTALTINSMEKLRVRVSDLPASAGRTRSSTIKSLLRRRLSRSSPNGSPAEFVAVHLQRDSIAGRATDLRVAPHSHRSESCQGRKTESPHPPRPTGLRSESEVGKKLVNPGLARRFPTHGALIGTFRAN